MSLTVMLMGSVVEADTKQSDEKFGPDHLAVIDNSEIAAVLESAFGTKRTSRELVPMSAIG